MYLTYTLTNIKMMSKNKKAAQGVGTLIIFIALVLVSAIAAAVLISSASSFQSKAFDVGRQAQEKITTAVDVVQVKVSDVSDGMIDASTDSYAIRVRLASGSVPVKLEDITVTVDTESNSQVLNYLNAATTVNSFNVSYLTNAGVADNSGYIMPGELVELNALAEATVEEQESVNIQILNKNGAPVPIGITTPTAMVQTSQSLYP